MAGNTDTACQSDQEWLRLVHLLHILLIKRCFVKDTLGQKKENTLVRQIKLTLCCEEKKAKMCPMLVRDYEHLLHVYKALFVQ